eukprot:gene3373-13406_t
MKRKLTATELSSRIFKQKFAVHQAPDRSHTRHKAKKKLVTCTPPQSKFSSHSIVSMYLQLLLSLCLCIGASAGVGSDQKLLDWALKNGGKANVKLGTNSQGQRGLIATKKVRAGDVLVSIPLPLAIPLGSGSLTSPELAIHMLKEKHAHAPRFSPYFDALPEKNDVICAEAIPRVLMPLLHRKELVELVETKQKWFDQVLNGSAPGLELTLRSALPEIVVTEEDFKWATCMVTSRSLSGPGGTMYLVPVIDMANHAADSTNEVRFREKDKKMELVAKSPLKAGDEMELVAKSPLKAGDEMELVAKSPLKAGDEVTISYGALRSDEATLIYGFTLQGEGSLSPIYKLCAVDCPEYDPALPPGHNVHQQYNLDDGEEAVRQELDRVHRRYASSLLSAEHEENDRYNAVQWCKDATWVPGMHLADLETEAEIERDLICDKASAQIDQMIQLCNTALEWEEYRLQQLLSSGGEEL